MGLVGHQFGHPLEDREISFLLGGEESESFEEGDDILADGVEVIGLEHPNTVSLVANGATFEVSFEKRQNHFVLLGHVQAQRHFPGHFVVSSAAEGKMKTPFSVDETGKVVPDGIWNLIGTKHYSDGLSC